MHSSKAWKLIIHYRARGDRTFLFFDTESDAVKEAERITEEVDNKGIEQAIAVKDASGKHVTFLVKDYLRIEIEPAETFS